MSPDSSWIDDDEFVYIESIDKKIEIENINNALYHL